MGKIDLHNYEAFLLDLIEGNLSAEDQAELQSFAIIHPELEIDLSVIDLPVIQNENIDFVGKEDLKKDDSGTEEIFRYLDNDLSAAEFQAFEKKLTDPVFAKEVEDCRQVFLKPESSVMFENKASLLKSEEDYFVTDRSIAYFENDLSKSEKAAFESELKNNVQLAAEFELLKATRLEADTQIVFENKNSLKKKNRVIFLFETRTVVSMAAALLLLIGLVSVFRLVSFDEQQKNPMSHVNDKGQDNQAEGIKSIDSSDNNTKQKTPALPVIIGSEKDRPVNGNLKASHLDPAPVKKTTPVDSFNLKQVQPEVVYQEQVPAIKESPVLVTESRTHVDTTNTKNYLLALEEFEEDESFDELGNKKNKGFWQKAAAVARQMNLLGVKSVDGEEGPGQQYRLSINAFSVEKH